MFERRVICFAPFWKGNNTKVVKWLRAFTLHEPLNYRWKWKVDFSSQQRASSKNHTARPISIAYFQSLYVFQEIHLRIPIQTIQFWIPLHCILKFYVGSYQQWISVFWMVDHLLSHSPPIHTPDSKWLFFTSNQEPLLWNFTSKKPSSNSFLWLANYPCST